VPLLILVDTLGQPAAELGMSLLLSVVKAVFFIGILFGISRLLLNRFLHWVAQTKNSEIFLLTIIMICFGAAWLSAAFGFSMAIGAFFAGLMLANTPHGGHITVEIISFRHVFVSLFFVSIGLLLDPYFFAMNLAPILSVVGFVLAVNFIVTFLIVVGFGYPPRVALTSSIILAQIGEFSFLLLEAARNPGYISNNFYQIFLSAAFITIFATPFLFKLTPHLIRLCERIPFFAMPPQEARRWKLSKATEPKDHLIICGFGQVGRDLFMALQYESVPFVIIEMRPDRVKEARELKAHVIYGDASNEELMRRAGIEKAKAVVVGISDAIGMIHIVRVVSRLNPKALLTVRTRFEKDVPKLYELGADAVVMEELEVSLELNGLVLSYLQLPKEKISQHLAKIRARKELSIEKTIFKRATEV
jgi:monovalent cation:H+ antiporter-2, CPA2 family